MQHCPHCQSIKIHSSRTKSRWEAWRKEITGKRLFRCHDCGWRGWGIESGPRFSREEIDSAMLSLAPDPPNLKETALARAERWTREIDLVKLDEDFPSRLGAEKN